MGILVGSDLVYYSSAMGERDSWPTISYRFDLEDDRGTDFVRVRQRVDRGAVVRFTVQYEAVIEGRTYPVVRYDSAHGMPHRDTLDWESRVLDKLWIGGRSLGEVATIAVNTIKANWRTYRAEFLRRKP